MRRWSLGRLPFERRRTPWITAGRFALEVRPHQVEKEEHPVRTTPTAGIRHLAAVLRRPEQRQGRNRLRQV